MLELPAELDEKETYLGLLENERKIFLETIFNSSNEGFTDDYKVVSALNSYEAACSDAADVGVNIVEKASLRILLKYIHISNSGAAAITLPSLSEF